MRAYELAREANIPFGVLRDLALDNLGVHLNTMSKVDPYEADLRKAIQTLADEQENIPDPTFGTPNTPQEKVTALPDDDAPRSIRFYDDKPIGKPYSGRQFTPPTSPEIVLPEDAPQPEEVTPPPANSVTLLGTSGQIAIVPAALAEDIKTWVRSLSPVNGSPHEIFGFRWLDPIEARRLGAEEVLRVITTFSHRKDFVMH